MPPLRFLGLLGGAAHVAGMSPAVRGRVRIAAEAMRRGRPVDRAVVTAILRDAHAEATRRGQSQTARAADPSNPFEPKGAGTVAPAPDGQTQGGRTVMQQANGPLVPELREGDSVTIHSGRFHPDVSDAPVPVIRDLIRQALADPNYNRGFVVAHLDQAWRDRVYNETGGS